MKDSPQYDYIVDFRMNISRDLHAMHNKSADQLPINFGICPDTRATEHDTQARVRASGMDEVTAFKGYRQYQVRFWISGDYRSVA